jgi:hypothetical protein
MYLKLKIKCMSIFSFKYNVFNARRWSVLHKHVACIDGRMKFVVVDGKTYVSFNMIYHRVVDSTKISALSDVREVSCYIFKCLRVDCGAVVQRPGFCAVVRA